MIDFNPQFEAAMQHACGNSLVCDSMDIARYVCYERGQDVKCECLLLYTNWGIEVNGRMGARKLTSTSFVRYRSRDSRWNRHSQVWIDHGWTELSWERKEVGREGGCW